MQINKFQILELCYGKIAIPDGNTLALINFMFSSDDY